MDRVPDLAPPRPFTPPTGDDENVVMGSPNPNREVGALNLDLEAMALGCDDWMHNIHCKFYLCPLCFFFYNPHSIMLVC